MFRTVVPLALAGVCFGNNATTFQLNITVTGFPGSSVWIAGSMNSWTFQESSDGTFSFDGQAGDVLFKLSNTSAWSGEEPAGWYQNAYSIESLSPVKACFDGNRFAQVDSDTAVSFGWGECPGFSGRYVTQTIAKPPGNGTITVRGGLPGLSWAGPNDAGFVAVPVPVTLSNLPVGYGFEFKFLSDGVYEEFASPCVSGFGNRLFTVSDMDGATYNAEGLGICNDDYEATQAPPATTTPAAMDTSFTPAAMDTTAAGQNETGCDDCFKGFYCAGGCTAKGAAQDSAVPAGCDRCGGAAGAWCAANKTTDCATTTNAPKSTSGATTLFASSAIALALAVSM